MSSVTEKPNMIKILIESMREQGIEITEGEARAFVALYGKGFITISSVAAMAGISFEEAKVAMQKFLAGQLAVQITDVVKGVPRYMPTVPWSAFTQYLDSFRNQTATSREQLDNHVKGHIQTLSNEVAKLKEDVATAVSTQIEKFAQDTIKARESISKTITEHIMKLNSDVETKKQEISEAFNQKNDAHNAKIQEYEQTLSTALDQKYDLLMSQTKEIHNDAAVKHDDAFKTLNGNIDSVLDNFTGQILDKVADENKESLNLLNIHIDGTFDKYVVDVKAILDSNREEVYQAYDNWHTELSDKFLSEIDKQLEVVRNSDAVLKDEISKSIETNFAWFMERARQLRERAATTFNSEIETQESEFYKLKDSISGVTSDLITRIKGTLEEIQGNFLEKIENQVKRLQADSTQLERKLSDQMDEKITNLIQECTSLKQNFGADLDSRLASVTEQVRAIEKHMISELSNLVSEHKSAIKSFSKSEQETIKNTANETKSSVSTLIKEMENALREWARSAENSLKEKAGEDEALKAKVSATIDDLNEIRKMQKTKLDELTEQLNSKLNSMVNMLNSNMENYVETNTKKFDGWFSNTEASVNKVIQTETGTLSARIEDMKNAANKTADLNLQWFKDRQSTLGDAAASVFNEEVEKTELEFYSLKDSISSGTDDLVKRFKDISSQIQERFLDAVLAQVNRLQNDTANLEKTLSETLDERNDAYRGELNTMRDEFYNVVDERVDDLDKRSHDLRTESINLLSEIIQTHKNNLQNIDNTKYNELDSTTAAMKSEVTETVTTEIGRVDTVHDEGHAAVDNQKQEIKNYINNDIARVNQMAQDVQSKVSNRISEGFSTIKAEIGEIDANYLQQIQDLTKATADEVNEIASNHAATFQSDATNLEKTLLELATAHQADYETNANTLNQNFASKLDETESTITNRLNAANGDMAQTFRESEARTLERAQLLRAVWQEVINVLPIQGELTWPIVGREAITEYIKDMLVRTKSTVSVVVPAFDDLPFEALMQTPSSRRVIVATKILATYRERVQQMLDKGNIQIRQRPEGDIFACARDGEEILIAPHVEGMKPSEEVALVSQQDGFAKVFHELIGPMWMSRAQKITRV
ncbi:MAG: hypothetical protein ACTSQI_17295 [Candidatus Helarchaeota archaeon]